MATSSDPAVPLWRNRPFAVFWVAQSLSFTGTQVSEFAIPLTAALALAAGAGQMGVLGAAELLPPLAFGLVAGLVVDRFRRASLLLWCGAGQAVVLATVPVAARLGVLTLPQLYAVAFVTASLALVYGLAATAYLPVLVDRRQLVAANSAMVLSDTAPSIAGPGLAGLLVQLLTAPIAVAADAVSFMVAAGLLLLGGRRPEPPPAPTGRLAGSLRDGLAGFLARPGLWGPTAATGWHGLFYGGILALYILFTVRELRLTPAQLGLVLAVATFGPMLAGAGAPFLTRRLGFRWTPVAAAALFAGNVLLPLAGGPLWLVVAMLVAARGTVGLGAVLIGITRDSTLQRSVPAERMGRVNAIVNLVQWGPVPVGSLAGGLLGQWLGLRPALLALAIGGVTSVGWAVAGAARTAE